MTKLVGMSRPDLFSGDSYVLKRLLSIELDQGSFLDRVTVVVRLMRLLLVDRYVLLVVLY
jgi:hypothetical protein